MRFSNGSWGIFWTFFEPFFGIFFFIGIRILMGSSNENYDFIVFIALGFSSFFLFKNILNKSLGAFNANKNLFIYRQIKPIDTIIARTLVEIFISIIIIMILVCLGVYFHYDLTIQNFPMVILTYCLLIIFAFSLGLCFAVLNIYYDRTKNIVNILLRPLIFISGLFFTVESLPYQLQTMVLYNPLIHFIEMLHGYFFYTLTDIYVNYQYMTLWILCPLYLGLWLYTKLEKRIISS